MRRLYILLAALCAVAVVAAQNPDSLAFVSAPWQTSRLGRGITAMSAQMEIFGSRQSIAIVRYNPKRHDTRIVQRTELEPVAKMAADAGAVVAINAGYWNVKSVTPSTYVRVDGMERSRTEKRELFRVNGIVAIDTRGRLHVFACDTTEYADYARRYDNILASGPVLVKAGTSLDYTAESGKFFKRHPRSVVGTTRRGKVVMVVVDGRLEQAAGMSVDELVRMCRWLRLHDAINLDGGGSSTLWSAGQGVLNHPSDNKSFDHEGARAVSSSIVVVP